MPEPIMSLWLWDVPSLSGVGGWRAKKSTEGSLAWGNGDLPGRSSWMGVGCPYTTQGIQLQLGPSSFLIHCQDLAWRNIYPVAAFAHPLPAFCGPGSKAQKGTTRS